MPVERALRQIEVRLVRPVLPRVDCVVLAVVVDANHQHHDVRLDPVPQPQQQQQFLIGAVGRHACVDDPPVGHLGAQHFGEARILLDVVAPHERVADEGDGGFRRCVMLDVAQAKAVMAHVDRANAGERNIGVGHRKPAKLGIVIVDALRADPVCTQIAQIDDAQDHFGHTECCNRESKAGSQPRASSRLALAAAFLPPLVPARPPHTAAFPA